MFYPRQYRIDVRNIRKHGRYVTRWSSLTAVQAKIYWEGLNLSGDYAARLYEFDGYREVCIARKVGL